MYDKRLGLPKNDAETVKWWGKAADQGNARAQLDLGFMYTEGQGVPKSDAEGLKWYQKATDQGNARAQSNLGLMYAQGRGAHQNYVHAHMWFNLAAMQGNQDAIKNQNIAVQRMTPAQIAEAQKLAREWRPIGRDGKSPNGARDRVSIHFWAASPKKSRFY